MYNLNDINIYKNKDYIKIKEDNKEYILYKIYNPQRIIEINNILKNQTEYYKIVKNINNEIITIYQDKYYVLLEINTKYLIQSNNIILNNNEYSNYQINQSNWIYLWTKKNDYYESISINNNYIKETINYYIGLAENAIEFIKYNDIYTNNLFICNCNKNDLNNPLNVVLDCKEREVGELIKRDFFYNNISIENIITNLGNYDIKKIIARLLYPNYYFDIVDEFINNKVDENKLKKILSKQTKYEELIKEISKYDQSIIIPNWIKKDK